jgi:Tfp pilus assembly protein PilO
MKSSNFRLLIIGLSAACFVGAAVVYSTFLIPAYNEVVVLRGKKEAAAAELKDTQAAIDAITELSKRYESLSVLKDRFSLILPQGEDLPVVINQLYSMAQKNAIQIESISLQRIVPTKTSIERTVRKQNSTLRITMRLAGDYYSAKNFFNGMQNNVRMMDINSIRVTGGAGQSKDGLKYQVEFDIYYQ